VEFEFVINDWSAWAPGLSTRAGWMRWASRPFLPAGDGVPELAEMPAMARRRLDPLGRMAAQAAWWCQRDDLGMPVVLASRYGDAARSLELLATLARDEPVSPTAFGLSVHNAVGAMYSIARHDCANYLAVAAAGLLHDGAHEVLVVCYDAPLPGAYAVFEGGPTARYAWAWRLALPAANEPRFSLCAHAPLLADTPAPDLPYGLDVLRFALSSDASFERTVENTRWRWSRHG
jgi:hypothetical protein